MFSIARAIRHKSTAIPWKPTPSSTTKSSNILRLAISQDPIYTRIDSVVARTLEPSLSTNTGTLSSLARYWIWFIQIFWRRSFTLFQISRRRRASHLACRQRTDLWFAYSPTLRTWNGRNVWIKCEKEWIACIFWWSRDWICDEGHTWRLERIIRVRHQWKGYARALLSVWWSASNISLVGTRIPRRSSIPRRLGIPNESNTSSCRSRTTVHD